MVGAVALRASQIASVEICATVVGSAVARAVPSAESLLSPTKIALQTFDAQKPERRSHAVIMQTAQLVQRVRLQQ